MGIEKVEQLLIYLTGRIDSKKEKADDTIPDNMVMNYLVGQKDATEFILDLLN